MSDAPPVLALAGAVDALQLDLDASQQQKLLDYLHLLQRWNRVYNLTSVDDLGRMLTHHLADSLAVVPSLRRVFPANALHVLDVGSGGGLPGIVLAVVQPGWRVTCVDAVAKKAAFVRQVALDLGLGHVTATHARVETLAPEAFDLVISRAFSSLSHFVDVTRHLLGPSGRWVAMKGKSPTEELRALSTDRNMFHVEPLKVPGLDAERCLVWIEPIAS